MLSLYLSNIDNDCFEQTGNTADTEAPFLDLMLSIFSAISKALAGRLSLSLGWENGPERGRNTVSFNS